jgi:periplasmic divalent cation tolerance protein
MGDVFFIYVTNPSKEEAERIAKHLLEKRLIACANIFPIDSMYWWEGRIAHEKEHVFIAKTLVGKADAVESEIKKMHSYKVPCIARIPVKTNADYFTWLRDEVKQ